MGLKTWGRLVLQSMRESAWILHAVLSLFLIWGFLLALVGSRTKAVRALSQAHRTSTWPWMRRLVEGYIIRNHAAVYREVRPVENVNVARYFGKRLLVLKAPVSEQEKGVLFVSFSDMFRLMHAYMDVPRLLQDFTFVFEPSFPGFCHPEMLKYTQYPDAIFVSAPSVGDFAFLSHLESNLKPITIGPADWVDPRIAQPYLNRPKEFDIIMNSGWMLLKRHRVLFRMLAGSRRQYKVALVGFGKERKMLDEQVSYYDVGDRVTIFEHIPYQQVMEITCKSRVSILLSLKEGGNRAVSESILCDVPVVLLSSHVGGVRKNVVPETGLLVEEHDLEAAITGLLDTKTMLHPRAWALEHITCFKSSEGLNQILKEHALQSGRPWTKDIACRSNSPDSVYTYPEDADRFRPWNEGLKKYLKEA